VVSAVAALAFVALLPLVGSQLAGAQATATAPAALSPSAHLEKGVCLVSGAPSVVAGTAALVVAPHPTGVKILWLPGLDSTACAIATTHAGASTAAALGRAITHAPAVSNAAAHFCPEDDGTRVVISFTYPHNQSGTRLVVDLGGCRFIGQSGREQRSTTPFVSEKLAALAPCGWRTYFPNSAKACSS
jgi:hypothetical protein